MNRRRLLQYGAFGLALPAFGAAGARPAAQDTDDDGDGDDERIVRAAIHPAIGIARVGNSTDRDGWFLGPETAGPHPLPAGGFKDGEGRMKRQAARFRLFGYDAEGNVVRELTSDGAETGSGTERNVEIAWTVHLANAKGAWYDFDEAFDIPGAMGRPPAPAMPAPAPLQSGRRNAAIVERERLVINPGPRRIRGRNANAAGDAPDLRFDGGSFLGLPVDLGELCTDDAGRLLVFGGAGRSAPAVPGLLANTFANNDLWHDDTGDGPVDATVRLNGRRIPVEGAWVVVAPPNYAPGIPGVVTMYDVLFEAAVALEPDLAPARPSFLRQIYPLFARMAANQWVNAGFLRDLGWGSGGDFLEPATLDALAHPGEKTRILRQTVFARFRDPAYRSMDEHALPPYYGDGVALPPDNPRQWMAVLASQYRSLRQWADGDFDADWPGQAPTFPDRLEDLPLAEQPGALDRAALDECLGGPFHPGCEMTWPMRHAAMYAAPFRLRRRPAPEPDWGDQMTSTIALGEDGPLSGSFPGSVTRWMAVPWQTDTSSCLSRYIPAVDDYLPTFWPARVPNDVLTPDQYAAVLDPDQPLPKRERAFATRLKWLRGLPSITGSPVPRINAFIAIWDKAGVVTREAGPDDGAPFPTTFWVERGHAIDPADPAIPKLMVTGEPGQFETSGPPLVADPGEDEPLDFRGAAEAVGAVPAAPAATAPGAPPAAATPTPEG
jgi:hypothetical protein